MSLADILNSLPPSKDDIRARLSIEYVCAWYGIILDNEGVGLCPFHEDHRPSFRLYETTDGVTKWHCYPCADGGDVIDLIARKESIGFTGALIRARALLASIPTDWRPTAELAPPPESTPDDWCDGLHALQEQAYSRASYVAATLRVPEEWGKYLVSTYKLGLDDQGALCFPYYSDVGELIACKVRYPDGSKVSLPGSRYFDLFGVVAPRRDHEVFALICEGETDMLWAKANAPADVRVLGAPGAAATPTDRMISPCIDAELTFLAFDPDDAGVKGAFRWYEALTQHDVMAVFVEIPEGLDLRRTKTPLPELLEERTLTLEEFEDLHGLRGIELD